MPYFYGIDEIYTPGEVGVCNAFHFFIVRIPAKQPAQPVSMLAF